MEMMAETPAPVQLQKLSPRHKEALSLLAQGVKRDLVGKLCDFAPEYITWLARQPVCQAYLREMNELQSVRLEALFEKSVDVIADTLQEGTEDGKLKAARLHLEVTGRVGRGAGQAQAPTEGDFLEVLAQRLVGLQRKVRERTYEGESKVIEITPQGQ